LATLYLLSFIVLIVLLPGYQLLANKDFMMAIYSDEPDGDDTQA